MEPQFRKLNFVIKSNIEPGFKIENFTLNNSMRKKSFKSKLNWNSFIFLKWKFYAWQHHEVLLPILSQIFQRVTMLSTRNHFLLLLFICYFLKLINSVNSNCVTIQMKPNPYSRQTLNRNAVRVKDFPAIY